MIKPSEQAVATNSLLTELISKYMDPQLVRVVNGAIPETTKVCRVKLVITLYLIKDATSLHSCLSSNGTIVSITLHYYMSREN
jgi:aldehyde dehydrogenase (NAD+)/aldehyde dehydrogenase (NAD(P)+)